MFSYDNIQRFKHYAPYPYFSFGHRCVDELLQIGSDLAVRSKFKSTAGGRVFNFEMSLNRSGQFGRINVEAERNIHVEVLCIKSLVPNSPNQHVFILNVA